ncbi:MAG: DegT/DnrJ/EryC1/StrS family aminotransferase [Nitrococcus sp.]|nr:DegT/DnrJ/EryC1/StrS family aminotransferase [Nitrococcus sp.]
MRSILDAPHILKVTSGRVALAMALRHAGVSSGDEVLVPAFHCESMITPIRWLGAHPVFYRIQRDLMIDMTDLDGKLSKATRALIVTHFFGFPQDTISLRRFCDKQHVVMIEDCAHAFFGSYAGYSMGCVGDYAIASVMKFFPVFDGGCLVSRESDLTAIPLGSPGFITAAKSAVNMLERATLYQRPGVMISPVRGALALKNLVWRAAKRRFGRTEKMNFAPPSSEGGSWFDPAWMDIGMTLPSRWVFDHTLLTEIPTIRRRNYEMLVAGTRSLPNSRILNSELPEGAVPMVFPLHVEEADRVASMLRKQGIAIWRFGEFIDAEARSVCPVSMDYSEHLLQFPCHQELCISDMAWLVGRIRSALLGGVGKNSGVTAS